MLKESTIADLKNEFEGRTTPESETGILPAPYVELITLDLVRIHINTEARETTIIDYIVNILQANHESGPLRIKPAIIQGTNFIHYIDITKF